MITNMNKLFILLLSLAWFTVSCGGDGSDAAAAATNQASDSNDVVAKREPVEKGEISRDGIEGRWKGEDGTSRIIEAGNIKTIAVSGVELRSESYEVSDVSVCTKETDGPYLNIKGGVTTCWQILRLDGDSLFLQLSSARPPMKFGRL